MRYFFNVTVNGVATSDSIGTEFDFFAGMQREAVHTLIAIAKDEATEIARQTFEIVVWDSEGPVYRASVSFEGRLEYSNSLAGS